MLSFTSLSENPKVLPTSDFVKKPEPRVPPEKKQSGPQAMGGDTISIHEEVSTSIQHTPSDGPTLVGKGRSAWLAWLPWLQKTFLKLAADGTEDGASGLNLYTVLKSLPNTSKKPRDSDIIWAVSGGCRTGYYLSLPRDERARANVTNGVSNALAGILGAISTDMSEKGGSQRAIKVTSKLGYSAWGVSGLSAFCDEVPKFVRLIRARRTRDTDKDRTRPSILTCGRSFLRVVTSVGQMHSAITGGAEAYEISAYSWVAASAGESIHSLLGFVEERQNNRPLAAASTQNVEV
jgi:hypothetical protein